MFAGPGYSAYRRAPAKTSEMIIGQSDAFWRWTRGYDCVDDVLAYDSGERETGKREVEKYTWVGMNMGEARKLINGKLKCPATSGKTRNPGGLQLCMCKVAQVIMARPSKRYTCRGKIIEREKSEIRPR